ncbi:phospholipid carrier-dependent glycosyltransferase [Pseudoflavonifractor sp. MSJ-37]|uniref:phospholipid carrier-dependent glycosyltransferase n=1 Tax=Pseudoflavonifractor sp. MSJ-37 TaxID=2841531 RepID=UPI001C11A4DE|nr:phospholipid carrier-dependent glycosyltransferase [Pseudoflavonifractor sp. MSJ-37]MBU5434541.1 phospholipid carrier-dependent glycosyltransferase [Pseudoflavonifractor sp. MSJ-37]
MDLLFQTVRPTLLFPVALLTALLVFFFSYWRALRSPASVHESILRGREGTGSLPPSPPLSFAGKCFPMERSDVLPVLLVTALYAFTAFFRLGSFTDPQSFQSFSGTGDTVEASFSQPVVIGRLMYYTGLGTGDYNVEVSPDGQRWSTLWTREDESGNTICYWADAEGYDPSYAMPQHYADLFKWLEIQPENPVEVRYLRITSKTAKDPFELGELALYDADGVQVVPDDPGTAAALFDESDTVPDRPDWTNSTYFDEIYHARTAYEHIRDVYPYEISHPPLGKLILGIGIRLFGMVPFGWRFMGTLFGVISLPLLYVFLKNLFGRTAAAVCGTTLFAFDFMHLTQTRIATIDTYAVFFILAMYYFLYRYLVLPAGTPFRKGAPWLFLSGLFWGIGAASKWTVIYGGLGLAALYFIGLYQKLRDWPRDKDGARTALGPWLAATLAFSVLCFVVMPACIYTLSYWPYAAAAGDGSLSNTIAEMWRNQQYMLSYHEGVHDSHPYSSRWFQWVTDARPILYYLDSTSVPGSKSAFAAFSDPVVCWGGLLALLSCAAQAFRRPRSKFLFFLLSAGAMAAALVEVDQIFDPALEPAVLARNGALLVLGLGLYLALGLFLSRTVPRADGRALFLLVGYLSQFGPWLLIGRTTFEYHYFPSILFLCIALAYVCDQLLEMGLPWMRRGVCAMTAGAVVLYAAFYPVLIGLMVPRWYTTWSLQWFPSWPF